jgi:glyoxylase-like metal-dependent hydrolase (beta-lactamase superfamily II)
MADFFTTRLIGENVWSIDGPANDLMYLVVGSRKAMLVDTGMGIGDLAWVVRRLTSLPVMVVNTHGHPDHAGGNSNFDEVWLPAKDEPIRQVMCTDKYRAGDLKAVFGEGDPRYAQLKAGLVPSRSFTIHFLEPGDTIDLGGRAFEVLAVPGHTPGSLCLLNAQEKLFFSGDSIVATPAWLYLEHSLPLKTYYEALKRVEARSGDFDAIFPGHQPTPLGRDHLLDLLACAQEIISTPGIGESVTTFAGRGVCWVHGRGQIIYNPERVL